jgi:hypothetical protein
LKRAGGWLVGAALGLGVCASLASGGCASRNVAIREHDWKHYEPDGGWKAFVPTHAEYEPGTMQAAAGQTSPSPVSASWLEAH